MSEEEIKEVAAEEPKAETPATETPAAETPVADAPASPEAAESAETPAAPAEGETPKTPEKKRDIFAELMGEDEDSVRIHKAKTNCFYFQCCTVFMSGFGDLGRIVISDFRGQCRDQHQAFPHQCTDPFFIRFNAVNTIVGKCYRCVPK